MMSWSARYSSMTPLVFRKQKNSLQASSATVSARFPMVPKLKITTLAVFEFSYQQEHCSLSKDGISSKDISCGMLCSKSRFFACNCCRCAMFMSRLLTVDKPFT